MATREKARRTNNTKPAAKAKKPKETQAIIPAEPESILGRAMLSNVCISMWEGRKHDREVTAKVQSDFHAEPDSGRYHKNLFGGKVKAMSSIITAAAGLRGTHYNHTLPWSDQGWRLLPTNNFMAYSEEMRKARARFMEAVDGFVAEYPRLKREAETKLRDMYRETDYPHPDSVRHKYRVSLEFSPLPAGDDFRVSLPQEELARISAEVEDRVKKSTALAMHEAWQRLGDEVSGLRAKLDDGKHLRESRIAHMREVAEILGRLNLTNDAHLETLRVRVITELGQFSAETLRDDVSARTQAAKAADDILHSMAGLYAPAPAKEA